MRPWIAVICFLNDLVFVEEQPQQPRRHKELDRNTHIDQHLQEYKEGGKLGDTGITTVFPTAALLLYPAMFASTLLKGFIVVIVASLAFAIPVRYAHIQFCNIIANHACVDGPSCQREGKHSRDNIGLTHLDVMLQCWSYTNRAIPPSTSSTRRNFTKIQLGSRLEDTPVYQCTLAVITGRPQWLYQSRCTRLECMNVIIIHMIQAVGITQVLTQRN